MKNKVQSRKFLLSCILLLMAIVSVPLQYATFVEATDFIKWILGIYVVGNVTQDVVIKKANTNELRRDC